MTPTIGSTYTVKHSRKGTFVMRVDSLDADFAHGEVVAGKASLISGNLVPGDKISVRMSLCKFELEGGDRVSL